MRNSKIEYLGPCFFLCLRSVCVIFVKRERETVWLRCIFFFIHIKISILRRGIDRDKEREKKDTAHVETFEQPKKKEKKNFYLCEIYVLLLLLLIYMNILLKCLCVSVCICVCIQTTNFVSVRRSTLK